MKKEKMKNKFVYIIGILSLCVVSCDKNFIKLAPPTQQNANTFYKTATDFQEALLGVYQALRGWADPTSWLMGEMRSDNARYNPIPTSAAIAIEYRQNVADWVDDKNNTVTASKYFNDYIGIERANIILDQIANAGFDAADKNNITGQTEVLRAFFYFDLVQFYGAVPLNLHTVSAPAEAFLPRSPADSVYSAIISDLTDAITKLPPAVTFPQTGYASIGTAKMLLANVYMVQKKFDLALPLLQAITQLGYSLNTTYNNAFLTTNKNSAESILEVQYSQAGGSSAAQYSQFIYWFIPPVSNSMVITGTPTNALNNAGSNDVPTQDLIASYEPGDARLPVSVAVIEGHYDGTGNFVPDTLKSILNNVTAPGETSLLFCNKYLHPSTTPGETDDNWPIYRYAEALLSLAECLNETGQSAAALPYLNQVRTRAGLTPSSTTDQTALRAVIAHERRIELAFENKRWLDLLRTGQAIPVMTAFAQHLKQTDPTVPSAAYVNIGPDRLLFPIPTTEISLNPDLTQNPGY